MGRVCQDAAGNVFKLIHLRKEIVPDVIAYPFDILSPGSGNIMNMGSIDYQSALFGNDLLELIHHLACGPNFIIHLRCLAEHDPIGFLFGNDMDF